MNQELVIIAHNIRSMHNVGSIFRSSDGVGASRLFLTGYTPCPPRKEISKTALGADEMISWQHHKNPLKLIRQLKNEGYKIIALEKNKKSKSIYSFQSNEPLCLILGNEIEGVDQSIQEECQYILHLPMHGQKISLNVSVAFGIAAYQLRHQ